VWDRKTAGAGKKHTLHSWPLGRKATTDRGHALAALIFGGGYTSLGLCAILPEALARTFINFPFSTIAQAENSASITCINKEF
jgi:hypothetical protein